MFKTMTYSEIEKNEHGKDYIFIDVRSEAEYEAETIPGAINIPILNNKEREVVGRTYKQEDVEKAKILGLDFVGKKLPQIYEKISSLDEKDKTLVFFCSRGGFRSSSIVGLVNSIGGKLVKMEGGYKAYRNHITENLPRLVEEKTFIVLYGNTGSGKTAILEDLKMLHRDVMDIEGAANHRGSILGAVGLGKQNSQKMFESILYHSIKDSRTDLIFTEGESRRIGKVLIPSYLFEKIKDGIHVNIKSPIDYRVETILADYVHGTDDELIEAISHLEKRLGKEKVERYIRWIKEDKYREVIKELMIYYYDPLYEKNTRHFVKSFNNTDHLETAKELIKWIETYQVKI